MENQIFKNLVSITLDSYNRSFDYEIDEMIEEDYAYVTFFYSNIETTLSIFYDEKNGKLKLDTYSESEEDLTAESLFEQLFYNLLDKTQYYKDRVNRLENELERRDQS